MPSQRQADEGYGIDVVHLEIEIRAILDSSLDTEERDTKVSSKFSSQGFASKFRNSCTEDIWGWTAIEDNESRPMPIEPWNQIHYAGSNQEINNLVIVDVFSKWTASPFRQQSNCSKRSSTTTVIQARFKHRITEYNLLVRAFRTSTAASTTDVHSDSAI